MTDQQGSEPRTIAVAGLGMRAVASAGASRLLDRTDPWWGLAGRSR